MSIKENMQQQIESYLERKPPALPSVHPTAGTDSGSRPTMRKNGQNGANSIWNRWEPPVSTSTRRSTSSSLTVSKRGDGDLAPSLRTPMWSFRTTTRRPFPRRKRQILRTGVGDDTTNAVAVMVAGMAIALNLKPKTGILFVLNSGEEGLETSGVRQLMKRILKGASRLYAIDGGLDTVVNDAVGSKRWKITVTTEGGRSFGAFGNRNASLSPR